MYALKHITTKPTLFALSCTAIGLIFGAIAGHGLAQNAPPTEHKGLSLEALGVVTEETMKVTVGLEEHILQLRAITIEPGGQIGKHSHATRPGIVKVVSGEWIEGRDSGETVYDVDTAAALIEDENTEHWFFNRGDGPGTALVCDIVPAS